jgi:hypothetical protein
MFSLNLISKFQLNHEQELIEWYLLKQKQFWIFPGNPFTKCDIFIQFLSSFIIEQIYEFNVFEN